MTKAEMGSSRDRFLPRIVLSPGTVLSCARVFDDAAPHEVFSVAVERERMHGLVGKASRALGAEREFFHAFVRTHRSPTGRTLDKTGRQNGVVYHLDERWVVLRADSEKYRDGHPSPLTLLLPAIRC
jgi:hypothetical protein